MGGLKRTKRDERDRYKHLRSTLTPDAHADGHSRRIQLEGHSPTSASSGRRSGIEAGRDSSMGSSTAVYLPASARTPVGRVIHAKERGCAMSSQTKPIRVVMTVSSNFDGLERQLWRWSVAVVGENAVSFQGYDCDVFFT
jgi:hypothetical protein